MKILHLSDFHVGKGQYREKLAVLFKRIIELYQGVDPRPVVLVTGDIIDDGQEWQYKETVEITKPLKENFEVLMCPGNHDFQDEGFGYFDLKCIGYFKKYFLELDPVANFPVISRINDCIFIGLDSMEGEREKHGWGSQGTIGERQLRALNRELETFSRESPDKKIVVYLHHHPFHDPSGWMLSKLHDAEAFVEVVKERPVGDGIKSQKVNYLLFGHKHREERWMDKEKKYGLDLIMCSKQTVDIERGTLEGTIGKAVFRFIEIDTMAGSVVPVEVLAFD